MRSLLGLALLLVVACAPPARVRYEERLQEAAPASSHAVHAERLAEVMRSLDRLVDERLPRAMDKEWERASRVKEISLIAHAIAKSARQIQTDNGERDRIAREQQDFAEGAEALERRAAALAQDAATLEPDEIGLRMQGLREACAACHHRFRPESRWNEPARPDDGS